MNTTVPKNFKSHLSKTHLAACQYAEMSLYVGPVNPATKAPLNGLGGHNKWSNDPEKVFHEFRKYPRGGLGMDLKRSNIFLLDFDNKPKQGIKALDSYHKLEEEYGKIPDTPNETTQNGGLHFYFRNLDPSLAVRMRGFWPGVDLFGAGYSVVAPTPGYEFQAGYAIGEIDFAPMPEWLVKEIRSRVKAGNGQYERKTSNEWGRLFADLGAGGGRHPALTSIAGHLLKKYVDTTICKHLLLAVNRAYCKPPLDDAEVLRTFRCICDAELRKMSGGRR